MIKTQTKLDFLNNLFEKIEEGKKRLKKPIAVFDADGTIWEKDAGDQFIQFCIEKNYLSKEVIKDLNEYKKKYFLEPEKALLWMASLYQDKKLEKVRQWSEECTVKYPFKSFKLIEKIISFLKEKNIPVYIVSASLSYPVEAYAKKLYGIEKDHIFGVCNHIKEGRITNEIKYFSFREGKMKLVESLNLGKILLGSGNSIDDFFFLEKSEIPLVLNSAKKEARVYKKEQEIKKIAEEKNWLFSLVD